LVRRGLKQRRSAREDLLSRALGSMVPPWAPAICRAM
jgi:hypothetical protein